MASHTRLVMIVKDEEAVIARSLRSVLPHVDDWCIVDTGSTDETKAVIAATAAELGVPGEIHDRPWVNFGHNRTEALQLAREQLPLIKATGWLLMMDADDIFHAPEGYKLKLTKRDKCAFGKNGLAVKCVRDCTVFWRTQLFRANAPWVYKGAVHEYATMTDPDSRPQRGSLDNTADVWINVRCEGSRSKSATKYADDAVALDAMVESDSDDMHRWLFYAAQSWRDAGESAKALDRYVLRAGMQDGYPEEQYMSLVNAIALTPNDDDALRYAWKSLDVNPRRREAVTLYFRRRREKCDDPPCAQQLYALGSCVDQMAAKAPLSTFLFADWNAYTWEFSFEFANVAYYTGHLAVALQHVTAAMEHAPPEYCLLLHDLRARISFRQATLQK